jgi:hypothetical protein
LPMVASAQGGDLPVISWAEFQRRVRVDGEELILVAGCVIDVSELQEGEHKGGAVYNFGADMTNLFMGAHANPPDRPSAHVESLQVVENIQEKVITWTVALLDESTRPTDPALIKVDLDGVAGYTELASSSGEKNLKTKSTDVDPQGRHPSLVGPVRGEGRDHHSFTDLHRLA